MSKTALQAMHRRAQKAEGELSRLRASILSAGRQGRRFEDHGRNYYMIGWMVAHIAPARHLVEQTDTPPPSQEEKP